MTPAGTAAHIMELAQRPRALGLVDLQPAAEIDASFEGVALTPADIAAA